MNKKVGPFAQQISIRPAINAVGAHLDRETLDDLKDKHHLMVVKKARQEYREGKGRDGGEFLKTLK